MKTPETPEQQYERQTGYPPPPGWPFKKAPAATHPAPKKKGNGWPVTLVVVGGLAVGVSLLVRFTTSVSGSLGSLSLSRANSLCSSSLGIYSQTRSHIVSGVCAQVQTYETVCGVLLVGGLLSLAAGVAWLIALANRKTAKS